MRIPQFSCVGIKLKAKKTTKGPGEPRAAVATNPSGQVRAAQLSRRMAPSAQTPAMKGTVSRCTHIQTSSRSSG